MTERCARRLAALAWGWLLAAALGAPWLAQAQSAAGAGPDAGASRVPDIYALAVLDADGHPYSFAPLRGHVLVVNFWATWCTPCLAEMPQLEKLQARFAKDGVRIVGLGTEEPEKVRKFRQQQGSKLTLLAGGYDALELARRLGDNLGLLPYTAVFSADGRVVHTRAGALSDGQLASWLQEATLRTPAASRQLR